ncbi:MAG: Crp/Fnr family transcriptional regulator [Bacteroidales bacterium]|nr:Crp/Fnr family transcriptional regulator [Bacteroidales bacterium]
MDYNVLLKNPLFRGISLTEIEEIIRNVPYRIRKFNPGEIIALNGEKVESLMLVLSGDVKGEMISEGGKVIRIENITASGALAAAFLFGNRNEYPVNVIAVNPTELLVILRSDLLKLLMRNDRILINYLDMISNRSQFLSEKIRFLNFKTIRKKLAHYLLKKSGKGEGSVILDVTQSELADLFGVTRPSVGRELGKLEEEGIIEAKGKKITILQRQKLLSLLID